MAKSWKCPVPVLSRELLGMALVVGMLALTVGPDAGRLSGQTPDKAADKAPAPQAPRDVAAPVPTPAPAVTPAAPSSGSFPPAQAQPGPTGIGGPSAQPSGVSGGPQPAFPGQPQLPPPGAGPGGPPPAVDTPVIGMSLTATPRFQFKIDPKTPVKDLLPPAPPVRKVRGPLLSDDLSGVPEVELQAVLDKSDVNKATQEIAHGIAKINHLNSKKTDGFLLELRGRRADLDGLPFAMGTACRTKGKRSEMFKQEVDLIRQTQQQPGSPVAPGMGGMNTMGSGAGPAVMTGAGARTFWARYQAACASRDADESGLDRSCREITTSARVAALMQIMAPESAETRLGLVKFLSSIPHADATRALAKLAIFSSEDEVRQAAVDALKVRRERDYTDVLERGLRYPLPAVARRTADAISKLERADLIPQLVAVLEESDPRAPVLEEKDGKKVPTVRELVRVNHNRNCLMCHSPSGDSVAPTTLTAGVPIPGQPINPPSQGYNTSIPEVLVRLDVTYLRQDFSQMQAVADAHPWPEMQRFDFLVRKRVLEKDEAEAYREKLEPREPGRLSPYHRAALVALRDLTGRDTEPTAAAWRKLLDLPAKRRAQEPSH